MPWLGWLRRGKRREITVRPEAEQQRRRFVFVGGRRYVADAPYLLPRDDADMNRLDFQHYMLRYALRGNYAAPIGQPRDILDVGCGTGRWAIEMAQLFPQANVIGVDLATPPVDEQAAVFERRPENYVFVEGNVLEGLKFADASFDFTHQRLLMGAIPAARWQGVVNELVRVTRPGGWVELIEAEPVDGAPALHALKEWQIQLTAKRGIDIMIGHRIGELVQGAGTVNGQFYILRLPIGSYGGRLGIMAEQNYLSLVASLRGHMLNAGVASEQAFDQAMAEARRELAQGRYLSNFYLAYGQRPRR